MRFAALVLLAGICSSCFTGTEPSTGPGERTGAAARPPTRPDRVEVRNEATGESRLRIDRAVDDLKQLGMWAKLTPGLDIVEIGSRSGRSSVPPDGHLADAFVTSVIEQGRARTLCDVLFFAAAVERDLRRWHRFYRGRRIDSRPPRLGQYWAVLLGHELAHCLPRNNGERAAQRWEWRVRKAYAREDG